MSLFTDLFQRRAPEDTEELGLLERYPGYVAVRIGPAGTEGLVCLSVDALGARAVRTDERRIQEHPELRGQVLAFLESFTQDPDVRKDHPREVSRAEAELRRLRRCA